MKRVITIVAAGALTFATVYGFAASLNLNTDSLGADQTVVAACQSATLTATYTSNYSASTPGYMVGTVTVTGLTSSCYNMAYKITLSGASDASLGEATGTTPGSGSNFSATFSPAVDASAVTGISVVISG